MLDFRSTHLPEQTVSPSPQATGPPSGGSIGTPPAPPAIPPPAPLMPRPPCPVRAASPPSMAEAPPAPFRSSDGRTQTPRERSQTQPETQVPSGVQRSPDRLA